MNSPGLEHREEGVGMDAHPMGLCESTHRDQSETKGGEWVFIDVEKAASLKRACLP